MLTLPIKKKWFDMILSGEKKEEYREIKPYWTSRFEKEIFKINSFYWFYEKSIIAENKEFYIMFRNGYKSNSPTIKCKINLTTGTGKEEWGAEKDKKYYVLKILSVEEVQADE